MNATYVGSTDRYLIPHANQCGSCHINDDKDPGDSPIGPKVRLLNRADELRQRRQRTSSSDWVDAGMLGGRAGADGRRRARSRTNVQRLPRFNVPGDAQRTSRALGAGAARAGWRERRSTRSCARARSLETNCAHCHNRDGLAQSTGVFFDVVPERRT